MDKPESRELTRGDREATEGQRDLVDAALLEEIDLLADLITGASSYTCHLTGQQLDSLLGLCPDSAPPPAIRREESSCAGPWPGD